MRVLERPRAPPRRPPSPPARAATDGCLGRLQALHLEDLKLEQPLPGAVLRQLAPSLTALTWRAVRVPDAFEVAAQQAAVVQGEDAELAQGLPALFQVMPSPAGGMLGRART